MPALSFSGTSSLGQFWDLILRRIKTQTCRQPRKRPIKEDDHLHLYWKQRVPKEKKVIHLICEATCIKTEQRKYSDFFDDDDFAKREGFRDAKELQEWFGDVTLYGDETYDVIHFDLIPEKQISIMISMLQDIVATYEREELLKRDRTYEYWKGYLKALQDVEKEVFTR